MTAQTNPIRTLGQVLEFHRSGGDIYEATTAYYANQDDYGLGREFKNCGQFVADLEEKQRPALLAIQRKRLSIIAAEMDKRGLAY